MTRIIRCVSCGCESEGGNTHYGAGIMSVFTQPCELIRLQEKENPTKKERTKLKTMEKKMIDMGVKKLKNGTFCKYEVHDWI